MSENIQDELDFDANIFTTETLPPAVKFEKPGDKVRGIVIGVKRKQQTVYKSKTGELAYWPNTGNPMMDAVVTLKTDLRESDEDNGLRRLFCLIEFGENSKFQAILTAIREAGATGMQVGADLELEFVTVDPDSENGRKLYAARYAKPGTRIKDAPAKK